MRPVLSRAALVLAALVLFALLALQVLTQGQLTLVDRALMLFLAGHRAGWVTSLMLVVSELHETTSLLGATAVIVAALAWRGHGRWAWLLVAVPTGMLLNVGLKQVFVRARPVLDEPLVQLATYSFPSGHAAASTLFYGAVLLLVLAHERRRAIRMAAAAAAAAMVLLVCFSRVYLGAHYLSDVLAGVAVGIAWLAAWSTFRRS